MDSQHFPRSSGQLQNDERPRAPVVVNWSPNLSSENNSSRNPFFLGSVPNGASDTVQFASLQRENVSHQATNQVPAIGPFQSGPMIVNFFPPAQSTMPYPTHDIGRFMPTAFSSVAAESMYGAALQAMIQQSSNMQPSSVIYNVPTPFVEATMLLRNPATVSNNWLPQYGAYVPPLSSHGGASLHEADNRLKPDGTYNFGRLFVQSACLVATLCRDDAHDHMMAVYGGSLNRVTWIQKEKSYYYGCTNSQCKIRVKLLCVGGEPAMYVIAEPKQGSRNSNRHTVPDCTASKRTGLSNYVKRLVDKVCVDKELYAAKLRGVGPSNILQVAGDFYLDHKHLLQPDLSCFNRIINQVRKSWFESWFAVSE
jgi:hypothetical protein